MSVNYLTDLYLPSTGHRAPATPDAACRHAVAILVDWSLNSAMNYLSGLLSYDYNRAGHSFEPGDESCAVGSLSSLR
jgi:hypothetical protein